MREGWINKKIGDVCQVSAGQGAPQGEDSYSDVGTPFVKAGNLVELINGKQESDIQKVSDEVAKAHRLVLYKTGSVVFAKSGMSCMKGHVYTLKNDCYVVSHLAILQPRNISSAYLNYYLQHHKPNNLIKDEGYPSISLKDIENSIISLPSNIEQENRVVSELDKINELIRLKKEQLKDYENLAQSIFYEMFGDPVENKKGWEERTMQDLCVNIVDCPHSTPKKVDYITDYPCIRTSELRGGSISWVTMQYLDEDEYNIRIARLKPEAGDIVFGREGTIGDAVILPLGYNFSLGQRTMLLRADTSIVSNIFLHRIILSDWIKHQIEYVNVSSTVAHVNIRDFKKFTVPLPPLQLQQVFASRITQIEALKAEVQRTIKDLETLLASRMQYWFD